MLGFYRKYNDTIMTCNIDAYCFIMCNNFSIIFLKLMFLVYVVDFFRQYQITYKA